MSLSWISVNEKLLAGVSLINSLSTLQYAKLLQHVTESKYEVPGQLQEIFQMSPTNLQLLVQSILYIYKQSAKVIIKPTVLHKQLVTSLKFNPDKAEEFVKMWTNQTKETFGNFENLQKLNTVSWDLNLQAASSNNHTETVPNVKMKFGLIDSMCNQNNVIFELSELGLHNMYNTLENIQNRLDFISCYTDSKNS